jgi:hypothetical protein
MVHTTAHTAPKCGLIKALTTGRNLAVTDAAHTQSHVAGAIVKEALDDDVDAASSEGEEFANTMMGSTWQMKNNKTRQTDRLWDSVFPFYFPSSVGFLGL